MHATQLDFPLDGCTVVIVDDVLFTGRTVRAAIDALFEYGRAGRVSARGARGPWPPRAADPARLRRQEPADVARRAGQRARARGRRRRRGHDRRRARGGAAYEAPALDRGSRPRRRSSGSSRSRPTFGQVADRADQEAAVAARAARDQPLLRGLDAHAQLVRAGRQAPVRRRAEPRLQRLERREGRVAARHGRDALGLRAGRDRDPLAHAGAPALLAGWTPAAVVNAGDGKHQHPTQALLDCYTLERASARWRAAASGSSATCCTRASPARASRRFTRLGAQVTVAGPPTLVPDDSRRSAPGAPDLEDLREADVVYALRMQHERMERLVRALAARVRAPLPDQRAPARPAPAADAPGPGQPRRRALGRGHRLAPGAHHRAGGGRGRRAHGGALRGARRHAPARRTRRTRQPVARSARSRRPHERSSPRARPAGGLLLARRPACSTREPASTAATTCSCAAARSPSSARPARSRARRGRDRRGRGQAPVPGLRRPARSPAHARARSTRRTSRPARARRPPAATARVVAMPNTDPALDQPALLRGMRAAARRDARVPVGFMAGDQPSGCRRAADRHERAARRRRARLHRRRQAGRLRRPAAPRAALPAAVRRRARAARGGSGALGRRRDARGRVSVELGLAGIPSISESTMIARDALIAGHEDGRVHFQHLSARVGRGARRPPLARRAVSGEVTPAPPAADRRGRAHARHATSR